jgi:hypothetical protein
MTPIVEGIIAVLEGDSSDNAMHNAMVDAAFLFEKSRGVPPCGWSDEVVQSNASTEDIRRLREAVVRFVQRTGVGTWTLGKCVDPSLKPLFVEVLQRSLKVEEGDLFEAMIALDRIGEPVFGGLNNRCCLAVEVNRELARRYLENQR